MSSSNSDLEILDDDFELSSEEEDHSSSEEYPEPKGPALTKINTFDLKEKPARSGSSNRKRKSPPRAKSEPKEKKPRMKDPERDVKPVKKETKLSKPVNPPKSGPNVAKRGQLFSNGEIAFMLFQLYKGLDNKKAAEAYLDHFKNTSRTKITLQNKFGSLRTEAVSKMTGQIINTDRQHAFDALRPAMVQKGEEFYLLHKKANFKAIQVSGQIPLDHEHGASFRRRGLGRLPVPLPPNGNYHRRN
jgi:hypothetical protein